MSSINLSFSDFCRNENLTGHCLVRPSIFVVDSSQRVFSKIEKSKNLKILTEVVVRIFLAIIVTVIAVPSLLLSSFGLLIKIIDLKICKKRVDTPPPVPANRSINDNQPFKSVTFNEPRDQWPEVDALLNEIEEHINLEDYVSANKKLQAENLTGFRVEAHAKTRSPTDDGTPQSVRYLYEKLFTIEVRLITALYEIKINEAGGVIIPKTDDGNCLFHSFLAACKLSNIKIPLSNAKELRQATTDWLKSNLKDEKFQSYMLESIKNEYEARLKALNNDLEAYSSILSMSLEEGVKQETEKSIQDASHRLTNVSKTLKRINDNNLSDSEKHTLFQEHIALVSREGSYSSYAEAYALANAFNVSINVHEIFSMNGEFRVSLLQNFVSLNSKSAVNILFVNGNHFIPFVPSSAFTGIIT